MSSNNSACAGNSCLTESDIMFIKQAKLRMNLSENGFIDLNNRWSLSWNQDTFQIKDKLSENNKQNELHFVVVSCF